MKPRKYLGAYFSNIVMEWNDDYMIMYIIKLILAWYRHAYIIEYYKKKKKKNNYNNIKNKLYIPKTIGWTQQKLLNSIYRTYFHQWISQ